VGREQRWAASGVVVLLGVIWGGIALVGVTAPWRDTGPPDDSMGLVWVWLIACIALVVAVVWQSLALFAWAVLLWTPAARGADSQDDAAGDDRVRGRDA
jgi:uncharacterized membrane protein YhaH (DUF805 family)